MFQYNFESVFVKLVKLAYFAHKTETLYSSTMVSRKDTKTVLFLR